MENSNDANKISDFSKGIDLMTKSLFEAAKKASFRIGFGALAMGLTYLFMLDLNAPEQIKILIGLGVFFVAARVGGLLDEILDKKMFKKESGVGKNDNSGRQIEAGKIDEEVLELEKEKVVEKASHYKV